MMTDVYKKALLCTGLFLGNIWKIPNLGANAPQGMTKQEGTRALLKDAETSSA